jgi:alpha-tubulin suppressor-like RCC1 family protein
MWKGQGSGIIASGEYHNLFILFGKDGRDCVGSYGHNSFGQLGREKDDGSALVDLHLGRQIIPCVAGGATHSAIVLGSSNELLTFGFGCLANQFPPQRAVFSPTPMLVQGLPSTGGAAASRIKGVACGNDCTMVVFDDGKAMAFGKNTSGHLCVASDEEYILVPTPVVGLPEIEAVAMCAAVTRSCLFLLKDGRVAVSGVRSSDPLGGPEILPALADVISIGAGANFFAAVTRDGRVATWGEGHHGELGHGFKRYLKWIYQPVVHTLSDKDSEGSGSPPPMVAGDVLFGGKREYTKVQAEGWESIAHVMTPTFIKNIRDASAVSCGSFHLAILHQDGSVSTCGRKTLGDQSGWLGEKKEGPPADQRPEFVPTKIRNIPPVGAKAISCGDFHTMIRYEDKIIVLGSNKFGALGVRNNPRLQKNIIRVPR